MPRLVSRPRTCRSNKKRPGGRFFWSLLFFLTLFGSPGLHAQKTVSQVVLEPEIDRLLVQGEDCFRIRILSQESREVRLEAEMQGEYQEALVVRTEKLGTTLRVGTEFAPGFDLPNDKLGAHKVFSVDLLLVVPEDLEIVLTARNCELRTSGKLQSFEATVDGGICILDHQGASTWVRTQRAGIEANVSRGTVTANSQFGTTRIAEIPAGPQSYRFESTHGGITVSHNP